MAANLLDKDERRVSDRITAYALYTDPPLGRAGMTEAEGSVSAAANPGRVPPGRIGPGRGTGDNG